MIHTSHCNFNCSSFFIVDPNPAFIFCTLLPKKNKLIFMEKFWPLLWCNTSTEALTLYGFLRHWILHVLMLCEERLWNFDWTKKIKNWARSAILIFNFFFRWKFNKEIYIFMSVLWVQQKKVILLKKQREEPVKGFLWALCFFSLPSEIFCVVGKFMNKMKMCQSAIFFGVV